MRKLAGLFSAAALVVTVACGSTDTGITTAVKSKLAADDTVKAYQVDVDTDNGVVTLNGRPSLRRPTECAGWSERSCPEAENTTPSRMTSGVPSSSRSCSEERRYSSSARDCCCAAPTPSRASTRASIRGVCWRSA